MMAEKKKADPRVCTLSTGVRVCVSPINPATLTDIQKEIENPPVPTRLGDDLQLVPVLDHPDYLAQCEQRDMERASAMMDVIALFNVELVDGLPEDSKWIKKLAMLNKIGRLDLSNFDLDDDDDLEFLYKKHIAVATEDWAHIFKLTGVPGEIVAHMETGTE